MLLLVACTLQIPVTNLGQKYLTGISWFSSKVTCKLYNNISDYSKVHLRRIHEDPEGEYRYHSTLPLTSALDGVWSTPHSARFISGKEPLPTV